MDKRLYPANQCLFSMKLIALLLTTVCLANIVVFETKSKVSNPARIMGDREYGFIISNGKFLDLPKGNYSLRVDSNQRTEGDYRSTGVFFVVSDDFEVVNYEGVR